MTKMGGLAGATAGAADTGFAVGDEGGRVHELLI
jgi:hypothetical protein